MSLNSEAINYPTNRAIVLRNVTCAYCGKPLDATLPATKEHVIGRRFVPRGCFDGGWNLILNACEPCNREKANLEDDISAISMQPSLDGLYPTDDPRLIAEAQRKAINARSRRTSKTVANSKEQHAFELPMRGGTLTYTIDAPAQVEEARLFRLAHMQFRAFFYWITYSDETGTGRFVDGELYALGAVRRADWGNVQMRWFMDQVRDWDTRVHALGADGFFNVIIRRHPDGRPVWAWALEWNQSFRLAGFAGPNAKVAEVLTLMPRLESDFEYGSGENKVWGRYDKALLDAEDDLFSEPDIIAPHAQDVLD